MRASGDTFFGVPLIGCREAHSNGGDKHGKGSGVARGMASWIVRARGRRTRLRMADGETGFMGLRRRARMAAQAVTTAFSA